MPDFRVTFTYFDSDNHETTRTRYLFGVADMATAIGYARDLAEAEMPLLAGGMRPTIEVAQEITLVALAYKAAAEAGSEIEQKAVFSLRRDDGGKSVYTLPGFDKDTYTIQGGAIDLSDPDVVAYMNEIIDFGWGDRRGGDFTFAIAGEEGFG